MNATEIEKYTHDVNLFLYNALMMINWDFNTSREFTLNHL